MPSQLGAKADVCRAIMAAEPYEFNYEEGSAAAVSTAPKEASHAVTTLKAVPVPGAEKLPEEFFMEVGEALEKVSQALIKMESGAGDRGTLDALYRDIHSVKGACQLFGLNEASTLSHAMESSLEILKDNTTHEIDKIHVNTLLMCVDLMHQCIHEAGNEEVMREVPLMVSLLAPFTPTSEVKSADAIEAADVAASVVAAISSVQVQTQTQTQVSQPSQTTQTETEKADTTIRVQVSLLDRLMALMSEMVLVRNQVLQYSNKTDDLEFLNLSQKLDVVTSELQEETMKTRMQPIGNILSKFQRVVRDLSGALNKKINLELHGVETELDKTLIEAVKDPLTHIVRNSCDHGVETPEARLAAGKSETGTIVIKAFHEGGQVIVEISDDGKGLSREKLLKKAIEKGIVDPTKVDKMSEREVQGLIFAPGFSTAEKVTNVSGRGVGMDVVKSNIEKIGGLVDISSTEGKGTKIILKIPLTLAIVPAMIIRSDKDQFAIPQVKLVELVRMERSSIEYVQGQPVYRLRGDILTLIDLKEVLGTKEQDTSDEAINIVVLKSENNLFGMIVDEILDTADIVVKPLARFLKTISIYSGATVLGDGSVAFILDVLGIAQKHLRSVSHEKRQEMDSNYDHMNNESEVREFVLIRLSSTTKHAIPLSVVSRIEEVKTSSIEVSGYQRVIRYRDGILKIVNLNEILGYPKINTDKEITQMIVVKFDDQLLGMEVDQIIDVLSSRDFLDESVVTHEAIAGNLATKNEIIVVVNVEKVVELTRHKKPTMVPGLRGQKILLVEDTDSIRNRVLRDLTDDGFDVETAVDGLDGLKKIAAHRCGFDIIISDIEMPKMNGYDFARKVRSIHQMKDIPMIAFTTKNTAPDLQEAKAAGFTTFVEKTKGNMLGALIKEYTGFNKRKSA